MHDKTYPSLVVQYERGGTTHIRERDMYRQTVTILQSVALTAQSCFSFIAEIDQQVATANRSQPPCRFVCRALTVASESDRQDTRISLLYLRCQCRRNEGT